MDDYMQFIESFSTIAFFGLKWKDEPADQEIRSMFEKQWTNLRQAVLCIFRPRGLDLVQDRELYIYSITQYSRWTFQVCAVLCIRHCLLPYKKHKKGYLLLCYKG